MEIFKLFGSIMVEDKAAMNSLSKVDKEGSKLAGGFGKLGGIIAGAFSVAAVIGFGKKIVEASASIGAMEAQFDQVFKDGENEKAINGITKQVDDLGIHADRLTGAWNKFGGQVKGAGMESEQALEAVDKATRLAADGAAFFDKSLESSSDSLASFMKGNFAAGDAIGVFTSAKQMDVKANEMYGKSWADLNEAERQWLLLDTVEKTYEMNGAMGQASREAGAYENVMGNLRATFERLWAVIGEPVLDGFLIVVQNITTYIEDNMPKVEESLDKAITFGQTAFEKFGIAINFVKENMDIILPVIGGVTAAITAQLIIDTVRKGYAAFKLATEGTTIAQAALNLIMSANPFGIAAIAIGALVAAGIALYQNWDTVKEKASELKEKVLEIVDGAVTWGTNIVEGLWDGILGAKDWLLGKIGEWADSIARGFKDFFGIASPSKLMAEYGRYIDEGLAEGIENNKDKPINKMLAMSEAISGALQKISGYITSTVSIIEKEFDLWVLKNDVVSESSEYLEQQLEMQKQKHELLNEQIAATTHALDNAINVYGVGSAEALNYKNSLFTPPKLFRAIKKDYCLVYCPYCI